jgi:hypothetical protein
MFNAEQQRHHEMMELQTRIADESRALAANASTAQPVTTAGPKSFSCECGRVIPGNIGSKMWVKSPRTGRVAVLDYFTLDNAPPRTRSRIHDADIHKTGKANFTTAELAAIFKMCESVTLNAPAAIDDKWSQSMLCNPRPAARQPEARQRHTQAFHRYKTGR